MNVITYNEALNILRTEGGMRSLGSETISLDKIANRICAKNIKAPISNQPFDNSAMDGFALRSEDLAEAANDNPVALDVIGRVAAGGNIPAKPPVHGQCYEIMTGAPMPPGCDTVVPIENTEVQKGKILFRAIVAKNDHVRHAGEDFVAGDNVLGLGTKLGTQHILPLATLGIGKINVLKRPKVAVLSTGAEVVDDLSQDLTPGKIYNSTGPYLHSILPAFGAKSFFCGNVGDDVTRFRNKLSCMVDKKVDLAITTGAVSAGVYDFIRKELEDSGAKILFHKVGIRPGKPVLFAKLPNGGPLFIGLPGNPVASAAGLRFFVYPLIRAMQGLPPEAPQRGILKNGYHKAKTDFRFFLRATSNHTDKATCEVELSSKQQSFMVSSFIEANVWAVIPEGINDVRAGDLIDIYPLGTR